MYFLYRKEDAKVFVGISMVEMFGAVMLPEVQAGDSSAFRTELMAKVSSCLRVVGGKLHRQGGGTIRVDRR
jgi:hypothetical protein